MVKTVKTCTLKEFYAAFAAVGTVSNHERLMIRSLDVSPLNDVWRITVTTERREHGFRLDPIYPGGIRHRVYRDGPTAEEVMAIFKGQEV